MKRTHASTVIAFVLAGAVGGYLIDLAIEKRLRLKGKPETREDMKKFYDFLMRQGFGYCLIRDKMQALAGRDFDAPVED